MGGWIVGLLFSSVGMGIMTVVPLVLGFILMRRSGWAKRIGVVLLGWVVLLWGTVLVNAVIDFIRWVII